MVADSTHTTPDALDDEVLVERVIGGEVGAFDALIQRYQQRAVAVGYRLLGNVHDALEVAQEAFVRAYRNLHTLEERARFGPWLLRIVTNLALNQRRSRKVAPRVSFEDCLTDESQSADELVSDSPSSDERPGARLAAEELHERITAAMAQLPEQQRTALVLFSIEQLPQKEVSEIMGISVEAVKWHVFQARRKLKELLAEFL